MRIAVIAGGVGGARFVRGLREAVRRASDIDPLAGAAIDVIVNTGDDWWLAGLRITPDFDSMLYTLSGQNDEQRGWGRVGESERVAGELQAWGVTPEWFTLGDLDLGTHIARTSWLRAGETPSQVAARLQQRWELGVRLHPATDQEVDTHVIIAGDRGAAAGSREIHFQEWWTRYRAALPAAGFVQHGVDRAVPSEGALDALLDADVILVAPSNPVVSIGTQLSIPGMLEAITAEPAPIVGVSPIIGGASVRGMAEACLAAIGVAVDAGAIARHYGLRRDAGLLDGWLVAEEDAALVDGLEADGFAARAVPLWMRDLDTAAALASEAVAFALGLSS
ncbi:2-phospho-L-lactate transferase [Microcella alkalica]|uniref:LPPG:FO 2-phospho-L-lactate transferase n=1 Tax=Microcella alkalica TaxID=355930 RepID=A0A839E4R1_9MICO|nr:2-phospho-L-lactate transferase [Microcella alkalica]MBA8847361.1 LPPG:FO 2-phospho-L-lactate transferase [Microcella alkalica]